MEFTNVTGLVWGNAAHTDIDCVVTFAELGEVPFTASGGDDTTHGSHIYTRCVAGDFGVISPYVVPPAPSLPQRQMQALSSVSTAYNVVCGGKDPVTSKAIYVDCDVNGTVYPMNAGADAATAMDNGVRIFERMGSSLMPVVRDFNNTNHENVPIADAITISTLQGADALGYWQQKGVMVDAINAATTEAELDAVNTIFAVNTL